jgi:hypothetical protein
MHCWIWRHSKQVSQQIWSRNSNRILRLTEIQKGGPSEFEDGILTSISANSKTYGYRGIQNNRLSKFEDMPAFKTSVSANSITFCTYSMIKMSTSANSITFCTYDQNEYLCKTYRYWHLFLVFKKLLPDYLLDAWTPVESLCLSVCHAILEKTN